MSNPEQLVRTNCRLCGYLCGLTAHLQDGRVTAIEPDPTRYPYDASILMGCRRCQSNLDILDHPQRCNFPQKRAGERGSGEWQRITWEQGLDEIANRLHKLSERYGPETLATSIGGARAQYWPLHRFMNLWGSPNNMGIGQICWNLAIWMGALTFGAPIENELVPEMTACAVLWGVNPAESDNSHLWRTILLFKRAGGRLVVVDPIRTRTAAVADLWLPLRPATDGALALGLLHVIVERNLYDAPFVQTWCHGFDALRERVAEYTPARVEAITGICRDDIIGAAQMYAVKPASLISGRGVDQQGRNSAQTLRALAALRAVTGNVDVPGASHLTETPTCVPEAELELGSELTPTQRAKQLGAERWHLQTYRAHDRLSQHIERSGMRLPLRYLTSTHPNLVWQAMLTGEPYPVRALTVMASNPLLSQADSALIYRALKSLDLLVALELFVTPTAMLADYVLPIAGSLERPVLQTNAGLANIAYGGEQAIQPLYERKTDFDFWRDLGMRMGQQDAWPWASLREAFEYMLKPTGLGWDEFCATGLYYPEPRYYKHAQPNPATGEPYGFATPSGKVELYSQTLSDLSDDPLPGYSPLIHPANAQDGYPLALTTGSRQQPYYASEFRQVSKLRATHPLPRATVCSETAKALGLVEGDVVWIETRKGRVRFVLSVASMVPDLISAEYGWWYPERPAKEPILGGLWISNVNVLTSADAAECDPMLGQWSYTGLPCRMYKATAEETVSFLHPDESALVTKEYYSQ